MGTVRSSQNITALQAIPTLILGKDEERLGIVFELINHLSEDIRVCLATETLPESVQQAGIGLVLLVDAEPETVDSLSQFLSKADQSVLSLACLPAGELEGRQNELLKYVDDILLHPEELSLRLPFLEQRLIRREKSQLQNRAILETIVDGIVTINDRGVVVTFNPSAENIFEYSSAEVVGKSITMLMPEPFRTEHPTYMRRYQETGVARIIGIGREVVGLRKNGEEFPMDLAVSEFITDGKIFYTGVIRDITDRRQLEHEILRISDQERRRIGQDLHDGLGQMLTGIGLIAQSLLNRLEQSDSGYTDDMREVVDLIKEADRNARTIARGLVPVELDVHGLEHALTTLTADVEKLFGCSCSFSHTGAMPVLEMSAMTNLYRIAQESVSNAVKHGKATRVHIALNSESNRLKLTVTDDGIGIPENQSRGQGMGIPIMKYRARAIGATLEVAASPDQGTIVTCLLNLN